jgi:FtsZ-interacting cell division protein ZipA
MTYIVVIIALIALMAIVALNVWYRRHRSLLTKRQAEKADREQEAECTIW